MDSFSFFPSSNEEHTISQKTRRVLSNNESIQSHKILLHSWKYSCSLFMSYPLTHQVVALLLGSFILDTLIYNHDRYLWWYPIWSISTVRTSFVPFGLDVLKVKSFSLSLNKKISLLNNVMFTLNVSILHEKIVHSLIHQMNPPSFRVDHIVSWKIPVVNIHTNTCSSSYRLINHGKIHATLWVRSKTMIEV